MKIVLATGIYPPDIGGPATYVRNLAERLTAMGGQVTVIAYAPKGPPPPAPWRVVTVGRGGGPTGADPGEHARA